MHPESRYILDCATELGEITPLEYTILSRNTPAARTFDALMERQAPLPDHWLRNTARAYLEDLDEATRHVWALIGLRDMEYGVKALEERIEFSVRCKVQSDLGVAPRSNLSFIAELTDAFDAPVFVKPQDVTPSNVHAFIDERFGAAREYLQADLAYARAALTWFAQGNQGQARRIAEDLLQKEQDLPTLRQTLRTLNAFGPDVAPASKLHRKARSAIKKAVRLLTRTGMEDTVRMFVTGHEVEISHPESPFKFVLRPNTRAGWLELKTLRPGYHTPFQLNLLTKEDVYVAQLCVLFDETPVLDQLLALTMFVKSGDEEELLRKANWFGYESRDALRGVLAEKAPALLDKFPADPTKGQGRIVPPVNQAEEEHWAPYKGPISTWISAGWLGEVKAGVRQLLTLTGPDNLVQALPA